MDQKSRRQVITALRKAAAALIGHDAVTIDLKLVEKLESDLRKMTKLYKSVPAEDSPEAVAQWKHIRHLFKTFKDNVETMVYRQAIHMLPRKERNQWAAKQLAETAWPFLMAMNDLFNTVWSPKADTHIPAPWLLKDKRDANIRRYQGHARKFFAALREFIDWSQRVERPLEREAATEKTSFAGVSVVIHKNPGDDDDYGEKMKPRFFEHLRDTIEAVKKAGFASAVEGLTIDLYTEDKTAGSEAAGTYDRYSDTLQIWLWGLEKPDVLIHEIGHRFYYRRLPKNALAEWVDVIKNKRAYMSNDAVVRWVAEVITPLWNSKRAEYTQDDVRKATERALADADEVTMAQFRHLAENLPSYTRDPVAVAETMTSHHSDDAVLVEHVTNYGATNPEEAFAEAFKLYVHKGPGALGEWTRQFFKDIVRSGGAKLRSSKKR